MDSIRGTGYYVGVKTNPTQEANMTGKTDLSLTDLAHRVATAVMSNDSKLTEQHGLSEQQVREVVLSLGYVLSGACLESSDAAKAFNTLVKAWKGQA